ncbi:MAG: HlyD family efflux transporter periplasmic adaptor subunit [Bdellovibrio sp.]|nr:HlyD family efflux transporter periplasmic adaptor subunit [Bdellovibrio sp.]
MYENLVGDSSQYDLEIEKRPRLRQDLKISQMRQNNHVSYVVKDPLKDQYYRFDQSEWAIIALFDGRSTIDEMVENYNKNHSLEPIDNQTLIDFKDGLAGMNLLQKSKQETNVMLIEKMKENRKTQLLAKKGSLLYKRFPVVDPDKFFNRIIEKISWIWSYGFLMCSCLIMIGAIAIIFSRWDIFQQGMTDLFSFNEMSWVNMVVLWITIYTTIAIHEFGHGLTCKRYGGEVHEIGFLLLFFQPCLYCNVNDAWLFDKKWKQVLVTIAGGYIEFLIGSICAYIWFFTNPNSFLNLISFQVMTICSVSTVLFNFNPLIKLDGYYLFSDLTGVPNLKQDSFGYLKYLVKRYAFNMPEPDFVATTREKKILLLYAVCSFFWMVGLLTGLFSMLRGLLIDYFYGTGMLISFWVGWKVFGGYIIGSGKFLATWYMRNVAFFRTKRNKMILSGVGVLLILGLFLPVNYKIYGECELGPEFLRSIRAMSDGKLIRMDKMDGQAVAAGEVIGRMENMTLPYDREVASIQVEKLTLELRKALVEDKDKVNELRKELNSQMMELSVKEKSIKALDLSYAQGGPSGGVLSCPDQVRTLNTYYKEGDEICKILGMARLKTLVHVPENEVRFVSAGQPIKFKLHSRPYVTYNGKVERIQQSSISDPKNPKLKQYLVEITVDNTGELRPGMTGKAKIIGAQLPLAQLFGIKLASMLRMDLFF